MKKEWAMIAYSMVVIVFLTAILVIFMPPSVWPSILGAAAALVIAFVAYPWQKARDRELKIAEEKRNAYREFFFAAEEFKSLHSSSPGGKMDESIRKAQSRLDSAKAGLALLATPSGLNVCEHYYASLQNLKSKSQAFRSKLAIVNKEVEVVDGENGADRSYKVLKMAVNSLEGKAWEDAFSEISRQRTSAVLSAREDCDLEHQDKNIEHSISSFFNFPRTH